MSGSEIHIRAMGEGDAPDVLKIYGEGIATGHATFQSHVPDWSKWRTSHLGSCRLIAANGRDIVGFAALAATSTRDVYRGVCEVSLYVAKDARGQGVGRALLTALIESAEMSGIWTLQAGIFPENEVSIALHKALGFRVVGIREKIGLMAYGPLANRWRDVVLLERRRPLL